MTAASNDDDDGRPGPGGCAVSCCASAQACVFGKAILSRSAGCSLARRHPVAEQEAVSCTSATALMNCGTLSALIRERAGFALRLPRPPAPLMHAKALQLQCGGLAALAAEMGGDAADVHALVTQAQARHGSLSDLPWDAVVRGLAAWQPRTRRGVPR
jgi:hypothetical protein